MLPSSKAAMDMILQICRLQSCCQGIHYAGVIPGILETDLLKSFTHTNSKIPDKTKALLEYYRKEGWIRDPNDLSPGSPAHTVAELIVKGAWFIIYSSGRSICRSLAGIAHVLNLMRVLGVPDSMNGKTVLYNDKLIKSFLQENDT